MTTDHTIRGKQVFEDEIAALKAISDRLGDPFDTNGASCRLE